MTIYRRNPLLMTVMGANPGGPAFVVIDSITGEVMYTKRATGVGSQAIKSCSEVAHRLASRNGRSYIVFLDTSRAYRGSRLNVGFVRTLGITEEVHPGGHVTRGNPRRARVSRNPFGEAVVAGVTGALVNRVFQRNPHLEGDPCELCGGPLHFMGVLGNREHYRCRSCGMDSSVQMERAARTTSRCPHGIKKGYRCLQCLRRENPRRSLKRNPAIARSWNGLKGRPRLAILEFAGIPYEQAKRLASRAWETLPPSIQTEVSKGWQENARSARNGKRPAKSVIQSNPGPRGKRKITMTVERFAEWVRSKRDPKMWKAFLQKFKGYEKWTHGSRARKVTVEWVDTPGVDGLWITYDGGKQPESTYIMPKGAKRTGAWKHPWDTMPDIKHDPQAKIVITKLRGQSKITDFYHK